MPCSSPFSGHMTLGIRKKQRKQKEEILANYNPNYTSEKARSLN